MLTAYWCTLRLVQIRISTAFFQKFYYLQLFNRLIYTNWLNQIVRRSWFFNKLKTDFALSVNPPETSRKIYTCRCM